MTPIPIVIPYNNSSTSSTYSLPQWLNYTLYGVFSFIIVGLAIIFLVFSITCFKEGDYLIGFITLLLLPLLITLEIVITCATFFT